MSRIELSYTQHNDHGCSGITTVLERLDGEDGDWGWHRIVSHTAACDCHRQELEDLQDCLPPGTTVSLPPGADAYWADESSFSLAGRTNVTPFDLLQRWVPPETLMAARRERE